jgi:hypothetical protein
VKKITIGYCSGIRIETYTEDMAKWDIKEGFLIIEYKNEKRTVMIPLSRLDFIMEEEV